MSTIPTTSKGRHTPYTVLGGRRAERSPSMMKRLSIVLLNRRRVLNRADFLEGLRRLEPDEIISIESGENAYEAEALVRSFPYLRIVLLPERLNWGAQVNLGMAEAQGNHVLVSWSDLRPEASHLPRNWPERIEEQEALCLLPQLATPRGEILPSLAVPAFHGKALRIVPLVPAREGQTSLYPFDYYGLFSRSRFQHLGGFDQDIENPYWQKVEFGFRSHLWGERTTVSTAFRLSIGEVPDPEDTTPDEAYRRTYLKVLAVRFRKDQGVLPRSSFFRYVLRSGLGLAEALAEFHGIRSWVRTNSYRFKLDAQSLIELWEVNDE